MQLIKQLPPPIPLKYQTEQFIIAAMALLLPMKNNGQLEIRNIEPNEAYRYEGNFRGLLKFLEVPDWQFHLVLQLNELSDPVDYDGETTGILLIPENALTGLRNLWR